MKYKLKLYLLTLLLFFILNIFLFSDNSLATIGSCKCSRTGMMSPIDCYTGQTDQAACATILSKNSTNNYVMCTYETDDDCYGSWKNNGGKVITATCGSGVCKAGQICIGGSTCYANTNESCTKNEDCSKYGGGTITGAESGKDYVCKDGNCYVSGVALTNYNKQKNDWIKIYNEIKPPSLSINIPGLDFSSISSTLDSEGYIHIPYIGQYLTAVYKFAIVAISIVAVIMLVIIGAGAIVSGGGDKKVEGIKRIGKVFLGLVIAWGSYAILYNINPDLVEFKALKVQYIVPRDIVEVDTITEPLTNIPITKGNNNVPDFKQFDKNWGTIIYGEQSNCKSIQATGCGPTSLSMLLAWYQEKVTPIEVAKFMGKPGYGVVCPKGTSMKTTMSKLPESTWNYTGEVIKKDIAIKYLKSGIPIMMSCKKCTGQGLSGPKSYKAHFIVLTGFDSNGNITVNDPGANNKVAIKNMTLNQIDDNGGFYYIYPNKKK